MTNYEEIVALLIFIPCIFCVIAGILSMASYRCACCCPTNNRRFRWRFRSCSSPQHRQEVPMSIFRLTQHTYHRLTQSGSILSCSGEEGNTAGGGGSNRTGSRGGGQIVTEFDYRQNLHMECSVMALEPPPPYAIAMKELNVGKGAG